jgi:DNA-binding IclR family transcriptional regulator
MVSATPISGTAFRSAETERTGGRMTERKDRQFVDALARGLKILEAFSRSSRPLTNGEIAKATDLAPSTVSRLTHTLTELGYLRLDPNARRYVLTPKNLMLGYPVLAGMSLLDRARPILGRLVTETGETAALAVRDGLHVTFVEVIHGHNLVAVRLATGARLPMAVSAAGLSVLVGLPEAEQRTLVVRIRADLTRREGDLAAFDRRLKQARAGPVAIVRDAWRKGIGGVAVALKQGEQVASLTIPVATGSISEDDMRGRLATALLDAAHYLGAEPEASSTKIETPKSARRRNH